jgi:hypothetical protein
MKGSKKTALKTVDFKKTFGTFFYNPYFCIPKSKKGLVWVMV